MKIALLSDIHSNLEAFEQVLDSLKEEKVQHYVFLGDLVGYGASPKACIQLLQELIRDTGCRCIAGNHDYAVCGLTPFDTYATHARESITWTKDQLNEPEMEFLRKLPLVQDIDLGSVHFTIAHANLSCPEEWGYIWDIDDADLSFQMLQNQICFIGHSHKPIVFTSGDIVDWFILDEIRIADGVKYLINVGSVGQPRDGNPKASYAVYDTDKKMVRIQRVDYDVKKAQSKIIHAGLPRMLADRLAMGK